MRGSDSVQCPRGGDVDAEDFDADPIDADGGQEQGGTEDTSDFEGRQTKAIARPGRAGNNNFCSGFGGGCTNHYHRWDHMDATSAHCHHANARRGEGRWTRWTRGNVTDERRAGRTRSDRAREEDHQREDGEGLTGKAKSDAENADRKENIFGHLRVGEAKNPGPEHEAVGACRTLPWSGDRPQDKLKYPVPNRPGFRDILTPGCQPDEHVGNNASGAEQFALRAETVNATAWGPLKKRLRRTKAHIVLAQETKVTEAAMAAASAWSLRNGWKMTGAPANRGKRAAPREVWPSL